jgi:arylsulfatase A-like enzyme
MQSRSSPVHLILLPALMLACRLSGPIPAPSNSPTLESASTPSPVGTVPPAPSTATATPPGATQRVIILSIDGLRPDAIELAPMPNLLGLMQSGAYTLSAQTVFPSATLPAHASMLGGLCPQKHGVDWNDYQTDRGIARGTDLFDLAHAAGLWTGMYVGKEKLRQVTDASSLDRYVFVNDRDKVLMQELLADFPFEFGLLFIHFGTTDAMGHVHGWLSPEQLSVAFRADEALGELLAALDSYGLRGETLLIVTADHGGHDRTHGSSLPQDMTIPWIAAGPGVQAVELSVPVHTMDTAATAAYALGLPLPEDWDGQPVLEAFGLPLDAAPRASCGR